MANNSFKVKKSLQIEPLASPTLNAEGDIGVNSTSHKIEFYNGTTTKQLATEDLITDHTSDTAGAHAASAISNTPNGNLSATDVQAALDELQSDVDSKASASLITDHISDTTDAHAASAVTNTPSGNLAATDVQSALNELQSDIDTRATASSVSDHISDTTDAHDASAISVTPSGNLAADDVQEALTELQSDVDGRVEKATLTTKGDIYIATGAGTVVRQAVGADNTYLKADSSQTNGVIWASVAGGNLTIATKTTTYTATTSDDIILVETGSSWTLTLYAASGNSGKSLVIKKTSSDFNVLTIDGNASETIDGATTTTINTQYETVRLVCDGSNWHIIDRKNTTDWVSYTPSNTQGFGTVSGANFKWRRDGENLEIQGGFTTGTVTASTAQIELPGSLVIGGTTSARIGVGLLLRSGTAGPYNILGVQGRTYVTFGAGASSHGDVPGNSLLGSSEAVLLNVTSIPISGWKSN